MKRDMDLIRKIVFAIEELPDHSLAADLKLDGYEPEFVGFQCYLMKQGGLIEGFDATSRVGKCPEVLPFHLTWAGYEFADSARNDTTWNKAKSTVVEKLGSASFAVLTEVLKNLAKSAMGM
jgi:hypothetical protein